MVHHYIKPQDLKTHRILEIIKLARFEMVVKVCLATDHSLNYDIFDLIKEFTTVFASTFLNIF
jgi:hypothetical protein